MAGVELWLIRHGDAEDGDGDDAARSLTPKGHAQAAAAAHVLAALDREFIALYTSPRVRAVETAGPVAEALGLEPHVHEALSSGFGPGDLATIILGLERDGRVILVGHEPDLSSLVEHTTGARIAMKKGGIAVVRFADEEVNQLVVLLRPGEIRLMAG